MAINRRDLLTGAGAFAALAGMPTPSADAGVRALDGAFPRKADFAIPEALTYINGAFTHPMPIAAADAVRKNVDTRLRPGPIADRGSELPAQVKAQFAALINARPAEISFVPNTSTAENLVVNGLGLANGGAGNVVTDALHFEGMLVHLQQLQRERGLELRIAMPREGRIEMRDLERLVDKQTKLIEISLVAMYNGFQHDLKAVCDLAHAHGAYVFADIVQAAGATPIDVRASGVDFAACSSFKWLMADFGLGFLYAREDLLERISRSQYGYHSVSRFATHFLPHDAPAAMPFTWDLGRDATAVFEVGSNAYAPMAALSASLPYLQQLGVDRIEAHRQPLLERLRRELPRLGYEVATPPGTRSALITFVVKDRQPVVDRLRQANVNVRVGDHFMRISPSVYNDMADIERLLAALD